MGAKTNRIPGILLSPKKEVKIFKHADRSVYKPNLLAVELVGLYFFQKYIVELSQQKYIWRFIQT